MELSPTRTKKYIKKALLDERLKAAVDKATQTALVKRKNKKDQIPYWEELRYKAHSIKRQVIENLDTYLEDLNKIVKKTGLQCIGPKTQRKPETLSPIWLRKTMSKRL